MLKIHQCIFLKYVQESTEFLGKNEVQLCRLDLKINYKLVTISPFQYIAQYLTLLYLKPEKILIRTNAGEKERKEKKSINDRIW